MNALVVRPDDPYDVRSLSLEEIISQDLRPPLLKRLANFVKVAVLAWGVISLGAVAGIAAYYLSGEPETALAVSEVPQPPKLLSVKPKPDRVAVAIDTVPTATDVFAPATLPTLSGLGALPPIAEARVPRPRPDEPIVTGSLGPPRYDPYYVPAHRRRIVDPCIALRNLGAPVRCGRQVRAYAPPPPPPRAEYYPRPYQPPVIRN